MNWPSACANRVRPDRLDCLKRSVVLFINQNDRWACADFVDKRFRFRSLLQIALGCGPRPEHQFLHKTIKNSRTFDAQGHPNRRATDPGAPTAHRSIGPGN
jgi:hypothetical protein